MTIHIAKSNRDNDYIIINNNMQYLWNNTLTEALSSSHKLYSQGNVDSKEDNISTQIDDWLSRLTANGMTLVATYTSETHPELFI